MIHSKAFDVEVFPNLFSITIIDIRDYFTAFADCVDAKGKPVPVAECLPVAEIKERLESIPVITFKISDTDDNDLLKIVAYFDSIKPYKDNNGEIHVYDFYGFNSLAYDDNMIRAYLMWFDKVDNSKQLCTKLYNISKKIIDLQKDKEAFYGDVELKAIRMYRLPYRSVDIQNVYGLNAAGVNIDKETGARVKFGKGLKNTSINVKWYELLDFTLPPIDEEEVQMFYQKSGYDAAKLNKLITNDFDRFIQPKYVDAMLHYNRNDVFIVIEMCRLSPGEVKLRYGLKQAFDIDCLSSARSNISDKLLIKFYSQFSGLVPREFEKLRTQRTRISFNKVIFPHIKFKTKELQDMLEEIKQVYIYHTTDKDFSKEITFDGTTYKLACGGIHSADPPRVLKSNDKYVYLHHD